jgi:hypothetical protein
LQYDTEKGQEIESGLQLNTPHQLLMFGNDVNLLDENANAVKSETFA